MMLLTQFCSTFEIHENNIYVAKNTKKLPRNIFFNTRNGMFIDDKYIIKRYEFKKKVRNACHEFYYFLIRYFTESDIGRIMADIDLSRSYQSWSVFVNNQLFSRPEFPILDYKIGGLMWTFFRAMRWFLRFVFNTAGVKLENVDLNAIHNLKDERCKGAY